MRTRRVRSGTGPGHRPSRPSSAASRAQRPAPAVHDQLADVVQSPATKGLSVRCSLAARGRSAPRPRRTIRCGAKTPPWSRAVGNAVNARTAVSPRSNPDSAYASTVIARLRSRSAMLPVCGRCWRCAAGGAVNAASLLIPRPMSAADDSGHPPCGQYASLTSGRVTRSLIPEVSPSGSYYEVARS